MVKGKGRHILFVGMASLLWGLATWCGCAHETILTNDAIHLYSGLTSGPLPVVTDSLVCVSYNIKFSEELDLALADLSSDSYLHQPDILLLQEMEPGGAAFLAENLGMNFYYYPSFISPHHGKLFGNAVLSPWPLSNPRHLILPHANPGTENHRVALAVDVKVGAWNVRAVSVHLSTPIVGLDGRLEQATAIRDSLVSDSGPTIIGGDFNSGTTWEETLFRRVVRKVGFREARIPLDRTVHGGPLDLLGYKLKLDHFYYRDLDFVSAGGNSEANASDHFPIWSVIKWKK